MAEQEGTGAEAQGSLHARVAAIIDTIRPALRGDGGDVELVKVEDDGAVHVRLQGACIGCPSASMTLTYGIERTLKERIPEVTRVVAVQ
jgi:Fe-S cluster biogenesis protein NfuA